MKKILTFLTFLVMVFLMACSSSSTTLSLSAVWGSLFCVEETSQFDVYIADFDEEAETTANLLGYYFDYPSTITSGKIGTYSTKIVTEIDSQDIPKHFLVENTLQIQGRFVDKDKNQIGEDFADSITSFCEYYVNESNKVVLISSTKDYNVHSVEKVDGKFTLKAYNFTITTTYEKNNANVSIKNLETATNDFTFANSSLSKKVDISDAKMLLDDEQVAQLLRSYSTDPDFAGTNTTITSFQMIEKTSGTLQSFSSSTKKITLAKVEFSQKVAERTAQGEDWVDEGYLPLDDFSKESVDCYVVSISNSAHSTSVPIKYYYIKNDTLGIQNTKYKKGKDHNFARLVQMQQDRLIFKLSDYTNDGIAFATLED